jgi:hypothetical protein
VISSNPH